MKVGTRVALKDDYFLDPGVIVSLRRSDDLYASGKLRKNGRGEVYAMVDWGRGQPCGYVLRDLIDLDDYLASDYDDLDDYLAAKGRRR